MKILLYVFYILALFYPMLIFPQIIYDDEGHIHQSEQVDWINAGLLSGTPSQADYVYDITIEPGQSWDQKVSSALQKARGDSGVSIVYFPAGTYQLYQTIELNNLDGNNIVFQGDGSNKTILEFTVGNNKRCFYIHGSPSDNLLNLEYDISKGSKTIYGTSFSSYFSSGDWIHFYENTFPYVENDFPKAVGQITQLDSINFNSAVIKDKASKDYSVNYDLIVRKILPVKNVGIEKLKLKRMDTGDAFGGENIWFEYAVNCWVKGVESEYTSRHHINTRYSSHIYISGCYLHHARDYDQGGRGYGICLELSSTNCLIENNIFKKLRHSMLVQGGANSNVFVYNYSREQYWTNNHWPSWITGMGADLSIHGNYPYANLFEHNWVEKIWADSWDGRKNGPYNALVRNMAKDHNGIMHTMILEDAPNSNVLGCELRLDETYTPIITSGNTTLSNDIYGILIYIDPPYNSYNTGILISHSALAMNWYYYKNYMHLHDISYFYSEKPVFLNQNYTFPSIGPEFTGQNIPSKDRYSATIKTYILDPIGWPPQPLTVNISGPTWLDNYVYGTFTANPSGGSGSYVDYKWWSRNDEGIITPLSLTGGVEPDAPLPGLWNQVSSWDGLTTVTPGYNWDFSLKCEVTDSEGQTATDIHSVIVGAPFPAVSQQNSAMAISAVPAEFSLQGNYPNPFNPVTTIRFGLPEAAHAKLVIYSITGAKVATLVDGYLSEGYHEAQWNGVNQAGARVASGIYIYELTSGEKRFIKKMLLAK